MTPSSPPGFPIVGIGASAGGLEALEGFFHGLPPKPGLAFVIITHLSPERESRLHEIVGRYTNLAVYVAVNEALVETNCVYVLPADAILSIEKGHLQIRKPHTSQRERKPIDVFFASLAAEHGELAAGVVLSGGDGDGTLGIKAIKEHGGLTLAQISDGYGPQHVEMPNSAISTGFVDFAVPVDKMGATLVEFAHSVNLFKDMAASSHAAEEGDVLEGVRQDICAILSNQVGHDFDGYKTKTFMRRVQRRMQIRQLARIDDYISLLRQESQEVGALFRDLLINVTNFFRDPDAFEHLATSVVPKLFEGRGADDTVRIWVPACATGEEVFSIGILLCEHMDQLTTLPRVQIFATDIDERALGVARTGRYPAALMDGISPERRERFFISNGASYVIGKEVRDLCVFSAHSVIRDPPFSRIDLVSCRNLLIYFGPDIQRQVIPIFHYALRPDGHLFLGTAENISQFGHLFAPVEKKRCIFRKRSTSGIRLPPRVGGPRPGNVAAQPMRKAAHRGIAFRQSVENQVLEQFAPPHVVVNREGNIIFYSSRTGKYLEAAAGAPTQHILAVARKGLRLDLQRVIREAVETGRTVTRDGISIEGDDGRVQMITLTVAPATETDGGEPLFLVLFGDQGPMLSRDEALGRTHLPQTGTTHQLEQELRDTREHLQSMMEEYETALEELKSSNEELISVNEEMQSTNEELEASKEELQSLNEELHTVNDNLNNKVEALDRANSDLQNLFDSTDTATVFLDRNLVIRSFTPAVVKVFNILPSDRGRPITDLASRFALPDFTDNIAGVLAGYGPIEQRIDPADHESHYLMRLGPYRKGDQRIEGVVVTFINITSLTQAEARQRVLIAELQHRTRNLLTIIQSIATQTLPKGDALNAFIIRLAALGRVQSLVSDATDDTVDFAEIVRLELEVYDAAQTGRITFGGPPVSLAHEQVQTLALAIHELATNAAKYGALRDRNGRLEVAWRIEKGVEDEPSLILDWRESGVSMPPDVSRRGYGRKLIEEALTFTLRARTKFNFGADGVSCRIALPLAPRSAADPSDQRQGGMHGTA